MTPPERSGMDSAFAREHASKTERSTAYLDQNHRVQDLPEVIVRDLNNYGLCVLDDFLGDQRAQKVLSEVLAMYSEGKFTDGKLVNPLPGDVRDQKHIRGDKISWIDGQEPGCSNIAYLINQVGSRVHKRKVNNDANVMRFLPFRWTMSSRRPTECRTTAN